MAYYVIVLSPLIGFLIWWLARSVRRIPTGHVGLVYLKYGRNMPEDRFRVRIHGSVGRQAEVLKADHLYFRSALLYKVTYAKQTYVPPGTFGVVVAKEGAAPPARPLCDHIESDHFQDGRAFLAGGGQMGRQPAVLHGGARYDINPWIFDVITTESIGAGKHDLVAEHLKEITVREGSTGVVIALDGNPQGDGDREVGLRVEGHLGFRRPWVFLANGGQRGAQEETLSHGVYAINPWFARVVFIPTRDLILEWGKKTDRDASNYDAALGRITVNIEGHRLSTEMSQTIRIPERAAPWLVGRFGETEKAFLDVGESAALGPVQRFVKRVLGRTVEGFFHNTASEYEVLDFLENHNEVCLALEGKVRQALVEWDVEAIHVTMDEFQPEDTGIEQFRRQIARERDRSLYLGQRVKNITIEAEIEQIATEIARDKGKVATAELEDQIRLLGKDGVAFERLVAQLVKMGVPEFIGSDPAVLMHMPMPAVGRLIDRYFSGKTGAAGALFDDAANGPGPDSSAGGPKPKSRVVSTMSSGRTESTDEDGSDDGDAPKRGRVRGLDKFREQREAGGSQRTGTDDA